MIFCASQELLECASGIAVKRNEISAAAKENDLTVDRRLKIDDLELHAMAFKSLICPRC